MSSQAFAELPQAAEIRQEDLLRLTAHPRLQLDDLLRYVLRLALTLGDSTQAACLLTLPDGSVPSPEFKALAVGRAHGGPSGAAIDRWAAEARCHLKDREPRELTAEDPRSVLNQESRSALLVPLMEDRRSLGFLYLEASRRRHYGEQHVARLRLLAAEAVPAIYRLLLRENATEMDLVGTSPALRAMERQLLYAARYDRLPVLITGERGSGKELAARAIHAWSARRRQPFVPVLMSGLPDTLAADELFGHERNAFTGAEQRRLGKFEAAAGGTLFLDEVADVNLAVQAALLRVVERNELSRLGRDLPVQVDARVTAATNRDLQAAMRAGQFREDLHDRLTVFEVKVPPLRERREDIPLLADYYLRTFCSDLQRKNELVQQHVCRSCKINCGAGCASPGFYEALNGYDWPGNVRELKHTVFRLAATVREEVLEARHLPEAFRDPRRTPETRPGNGWNLDDAIRRHIESALALAGHNKTHAAHLLGIPYTTLQSKLKKLGIEAPARSSDPPPAGHSPRRGQ